MLASGENELELPAVVDASQPPETITPLPDYGHHGPPETEVPASKMRTEANWVQVMEGNLDTAHISHLHQFFGGRDLPDDGTDRPGYPSSASRRWNEHLGSTGCATG